jgi:ABC-2 type transport system ATP-binding protein
MRNEDILKEGLAVMPEIQQSIKVDKLIKIYKGSDHAAVNSISFSVDQGSIFGLLGPNGAGKTTTISILCGLMKPTSGDVLIHGLSLKNQLDEIKAIIGVVPQDIALYPTLTAKENLLYIGRMYGLQATELKQKVGHYLDIFGLSKSAGKRVENFSGGMKRRVNLIAGILHDPKLLFLDEPTVGIDVQSRAVITEFLHKINKEGTTIVYTSHLMEEAENLCTHIAIIDEGEIKISGTPASLVRQHEVENIEKLFLKLTGKKLRD